MCQWQMFSTNRSEAKMRECEARSGPVFEKLTDKIQVVVYERTDQPPGPRDH